jgi:hypothetical protein
MEGYHDSQPSWTHYPSPNLSVDVKPLAFIAKRHLNIIVLPSICVSARMQHSLDDKPKSAQHGRHNLSFSSDFFRDYPPPFHPLVQYRMNGRRTPGRRQITTEDCRSAEGRQGHYSGGIGGASLSTIDNGS